MVDNGWQPHHLEAGAKLHPIAPLQQDGHAGATDTEQRGPVRFMDNPIPLPPFIHLCPLDSEQANLMLHPFVLSS